MTEKIVYTIDENDGIYSIEAGKITSNYMSKDGVCMVRILLSNKKIVHRRENQVFDKIEDCFENLIGNEY